MGYCGEYVQDRGAGAIENDFLARFSNFIAQHALDLKPKIAIMIDCRLHNRFEYHPATIRNPTESVSLDKSVNLSENGFLINLV